MKKFMPIIYVIAFVIGIIFIVTADTGLITSYYPALIAGVIISCLQECSLLSTYMFGISNLSELCQFQFVEDLMNPCNIGRCMNVNLRCLMY